MMTTQWYTVVGEYSLDQESSTVSLQTLICTHRERMYCHALTALSLSQT
jgi:hypothetical protein